MRRFDYSAPDSLAQVSQILTSTPDSRPLAGGTDLLIQMKERGRPVGHLVSLRNVGELRKLATNGALDVGAMVLCGELAWSDAVKKGWPIVADGAELVGSVQIRNKATVGGNLCNAAPSADVAPALIALDASAEIVGPGGARTQPVAALFVEDGKRRLTLEPGEWLAAVVVPPPAGWRADYAKARVRDAVDFPLAGAAVALHRDGDRLAGLRVVITGTNSAPLVVPTEGVVGRPWDDEAAKSLAKAVLATSNVLATTVAPVRYRRRMMQALVRRLVDELWTGA